MPSAPVPDGASRLADDPTFPPVTESERVFTGRVWNIQRETVVLDGTPMVRDFVDHTGAVAVLALDERDRVLLIKQYRHPVRLRDWELPAGLLDIADEDPLLAAQRELAEETDLVAETWHVLTEIMTSPGGSNEVLRVYLARGVSAASTVHERTEEEAGIEVRWVPLDEAVDAVLARTVQNAILAVAVLAADAARTRGWRTLGDPRAPWTRHPRHRAAPAPGEPHRP